MNFKKIFTLSLILVITLALAFNFAQAEPQKKGKKDQKKEETGPIYIPQEVKILIQQGIANRQPKLDIPFEFVPILYLPASTNIHSIFYFKAKNSDITFALPAAQATAQPAAQTETAQVPQEIKTRFHVFVQFNKLENNKTTVFKETYIPAEISLTDPEAESMLSFGYPLPPGKYLLALALASPDLTKVGINYFEFSLPDINTIYKENRLETTPLFLVQKIEEMPAVENVVQLHKDYFTWSVLKIYPDFAAQLKPGDTADILFFIYGAKPNEQQKFSIEVNYEVKKGEEPNPVLRWAASVYDTPFIEQPLPLIKTLLTKDDKGEREETKPLEPGKYSLVVKIYDRNSGLKTETSLPFEVVE